MSGLNYGRSFKRSHRWQNKEGVVYADFINKWIVRIRLNGKLTSHSQHKTEAEAIKCYKKL